MKSKVAPTRPDVVSLPDDWPVAKPNVVRSEEAADICARYAAARGEAFLFAFLAGSFSRGQQSTLSDLDLYIVESDAPPMLREQTVFQGMCLQVGSVSLPDAYLLVQQGQKTANPFYVAGVAESLHVAGDRTTYDAFADFARRVMAAGPAPAPSWRAHRKRIALINAYMKCGKAMRTADFLGSSVRFLDLLCDYWQMRRGGWVFERSWAVRKGCFPHALDDELSRLIIDGAADPAPFLRRAAETLQDIDAFAWTTAASGPLPLSPG